MEEVNLAQLTYLALTFDGRIPTAISMFWNLHYLIVNRHRSIVDSNRINSLYLPMEIWHMQKLKHLQAIGRNLPHPNCPNCEGSVLPKLSTLLDVSPQSCTTDVFERIPNLQTLGIRIELDPVHDNADEPLSFFDQISSLHKLLKLKYTIVNPMITSEVVPLSIFSSSLTELALSGFGYPWEELSKISSSLPNIFILKLRCYAFRGPKWEVGKNEFRKLSYLLIEDTDLVNWTFSDYSSLRELESLNMRHCYKLEEMPFTFAKDLRKVELVDSNPRAVSCAEQLKEYSDCYSLEFTIHSWDV